MFILVDRDGNAACSSSGEPFQYSTLDMATKAAKILGKAHKCHYRVVDA